MTLSTVVVSWWRTERFAAWAPFIVRLLLFAAIGVEIMTLGAWLPETLGVWLSPEMGDIGDFRHFYDKTESSTTLNQYSSGLMLLMRPLTWLDMLAAFQVYTAINVAALLGVAYLAQRPVRSPEARVAVFLGVIALPQAHWALRTGHFVPVLALLALSGFLLTERRPLLAGVCFGLLALKPQYLPVPILYLLWTRNWRAVLGAVGTLTVLSGVGLATVGSVAFRAQLQALLHTPLDHNELYMPVQQAWQYSWQGFLISAGIEPNPLVAADLFALSLGAVVLVWLTRAPSVAKVAAALGMLLLAPYSTFYNWALIAVAGALLLRSDVRPKFIIPMVLALGVLAMAATQKATPYPTLNVLGPGGTYGLYWAQPFALGSVFLLAFVGARKLRNQTEEAVESAAPAEATPRKKVRARRARAVPPLRQPAPRVPHLALGLALALVAMGSGFVVSAFVSQSGPFAPGPFSRQTVLRALPDDFPLPPEARVEHVGRGDLLPYRVEWRTTQRTSEVAGLYTNSLDEGNWQIVLSEGDEDEPRLRTARLDFAGLMEVFAEVSVVESDGSSTVTLEFTLLPTNRVSGFDDWLDDR